MFGGIVETVGQITAEELKNSCKQLSILPSHRFDDLRIGDSVSVNGVCLTVTHMRGEHFDCSAVPETLARTNLGLLCAGSFVNLERALKVSDRIGGHPVQGHVDEVGEISHIEAQGAAWLVTIQITPALTKYLVRQGYVALDGMSITLVDVEEACFRVTFIPHTRGVTIVKNYRLGDKVNVEVDILGKYAEKIMGGMRHAL